MALSDYFQMLGRSVLAVHRRKILLRRKHRFVRKEFLPDKLNCERRVCFLSYHKSYWHAIEANCFEFCLCMWWNDESGVSRRVLDDTNLPKWIDYVVNENKVISSHLGGARAVTSSEKTKFCLAADSRQRQNFSETQKFLLPHCHVCTIVNFKDERDSPALVNDASFRLLRELHLKPLIVSVNKCLL